MSALIAVSTPHLCAQESTPELPVKVPPFLQQVHITHTVNEGLPSNDVSRVAADDPGNIQAQTASGTVIFNQGEWKPTPATPLASETDMLLPKGSPKHASLLNTFPEAGELRDVAARADETVVAAQSGLFIYDGNAWSMALPQQGAVRWAPIDVRAVVYDAQGKLWFACPQGVGYRVERNDWRLFTGKEGLPFNDFTCAIAGKNDVWFGTTNGAIRYVEGDFEFRQGRRWLLDNHIRDIAVDIEGNAWIATAAGISCIRYVPTSLQEKADFFDAEIEKYHRRTEFGYVNPAKLEVPGDKATASPAVTDNDGHYQGLYLAAVSLGFAATGSETLREKAVRAFEALAFLSEAPAGGTHPAPAGFIARAVVPTGGEDPNIGEGREYNLLRREGDKRWKLIEPRWPIDATGEWYWKCDSSSDELDAHFLGFGTYYDRVCESEDEKAAVAAVVRRIADHLLAHNYRLVDHDGEPTRWTYMAPEDLNQDRAWFVERGLNSLSLLTFLLVTHHITGDQKYRDAYLELAIDHGYAMNGMTQPKFQAGPGSFGQGDDSMAFMNYYHLLRYETDPELLNMYYQAVFRHWQLEKYERNPYFNFIYAATCLGKTYEDQWRALDLSPPPLWIEDSIDTLKRFPLDLIDWPYSNAHRIDLVPLPDHTRIASGMTAPAGHAVDGKTFRIDENYIYMWGDDPWLLDRKGTGATLHEGVSYLLAYYMGLAHGFIAN